MIIRRVVPFLVAATAAVGLAMTAAGPAAAAKPATATQAAVSAAGVCLQFNPIHWQYNSVGSNKAMSSCFDSNNGTTFTAYTQVISTSFWTGFHGCVKAQFLLGTTVQYTTTEQRWGVDADHTRVIAWTASMPALYTWDRVTFLHRRC